VKAGEEITFSYRIISRRDPRTSWAMRMDHYIKTGDDNIHMANILYSFLAIAVLVFSLMSILGKQLWNDFTSLEVLKQNRRQKRDERRNMDHGSEEDVGLTTNRAKNVTANQVAWKKL
jgi:hypothetical protein